MRTVLIAFFSFVLVAMLAVTSWATNIESVFVGGAKILNEPWGIATLFDTYFAFFTFFIWVCYKENSWWRSALWLVAIILLGNLAMASYVLWEIKKVGANFSAERLLLRRP